MILRKTKAKGVVRVKENDRDSGQRRSATPLSQKADATKERKKSSLMNIEDGNREESPEKTFGLLMGSVKSEGG